MKRLNPYWVQEQSPSPYAVNLCRKTLRKLLQIIFEFLKLAGIRWRVKSSSLDPDSNVADRQMITHSTRYARLSAGIITCPERGRSRAEGQNSAYSLAGATKNSI